MTRLHTGAKPKRKPTDASPADILAAARKDPTCRILAIAAKCVWCKSGFADRADAVRHCESKDCPLFRLRPYQRDAKAAGKQQAAYRGIAGFGEGTEA